MLQNRRSIKKMIVLSSMFILASELNYPLVYAQENMKQSSAEETVQLDSTKSFKEEQSTAVFLEINPFKNKDTELSGKTIPEVKVELQNGETIQQVQSDEQGDFLFTEISAAKDFPIIVSVYNPKDEVQISKEVFASSTEEDSIEEAQKIEESKDEAKEESVQENQSEEINSEETNAEEISTEANNSEEIDSEKRNTDEQQKDSVQSFSSNAEDAISTKAISTAKATKFYKVAAGDTLFSIASKYEVSVKELQTWNSLTESNIKTGQLLGVNGTYTAKKPYNSRTEFIEEILPDAMKIAKEYNIYTSILLAQAIHESDGGNSALATVANNIFGIKALSSKYVEMPTWEEDKDGNRVDIIAKFEAYDTFYDSMVANAEKIRYGVSWNPEYYKGAWVENTASYLDVTEWLTGRYATDSAYGTKLINTIKTYNLTQYDEHIKITDPIISQKAIQYVGIVNKKDVPIYSQPVGTASSVQVGTTNEFLGQEVLVTQEKVNTAGTWAKITVEGKEIGFVKKDTLQLITVTANQKVNKLMRVTNANTLITTKPYGIEGFAVTASSKTYLDTNVTVTEESTTQLGTFGHIYMDGKEIGWISMDALEDAYFEVISEKDVLFAGKVMNGLYHLYSKPPYTENSELVREGKSIYGLEVRGSKEAATEKGTYVFVKVAGTQGWIEKKALNIDTVSKTNNYTYDAKISRKTDTINTLPWGVEGYQTVASSKDYYNKRVTITQEKTTPRATWALISLDGQTLGWIDKAGLSDLSETVLSTRKTTYMAKVTKAGHSIDSLPYGTYGYKKVGTSSTYLNGEVKVIEEKATLRATFALIQSKGKTIGWVDKAALTPEKITASKDKNYFAVVNRKTDTINTLPWGIDGFKTAGHSKDYYGQVVQVTKEAVTPRATWALISLNGQELGWIDVKALKDQLDIVTSTKKVEYMAEVTGSKHTIDSLPWGVEGFKTVGKSKDYVGKTYKVTQEKVTGRATWAYLQGLGWIDKAGLTPESITSSKDVNYTMFIGRKTDTINSLPWGLENFQTVAKSSDYLGQKVQVKKEAVTPRATWALITLNGKELGWIDIKGLVDMDIVISTTDVVYMAEVTAGKHTIDTLPWGVDGYKTIGRAQDYLGKTFKVTQEKVTGRATWAYLQGLGWIDKTGITSEKVTSSKEVDYTATVNRKTDTINTLPWGVEGFKTVTKSDKYYQKTVTVKKEATTSRAVWALIYLDGKEIGWIDVAGLKK